MRQSDGARKGVENRVLPKMLTEDGRFMFYTTIELKEGEDSTWIQILPVKTLEHPKHGTIDITSERVGRFAENINANVRGIDLDVDYDHKDDPAKGHKAAGWIKKGEARA